ncbi:D-cysteine desulfhydrase family protein [Pseudomaricurvus alcaniphilus]|uniref:D-cysteine desulfhydrase family protein n=1 Tax=Pseudomaricurvus alcaniphilus TaxID=1166482 RepID=UPI00140733FD|nr:D-cysteine desulfhydrase family protein [Pseudomaricurvus alcaniphilus]NHN35857.1 D-cysteine desulfhydrase family protein [Pseudomaricurvus alcaniphilus]
MLKLPPQVPLAQTPTPLQYLARASAEVGAKLWIKRDDLTGITLSGNKVRKLEFTLAKAMAEGCDTIITCGGLQSNHCRATAFACASLGLAAVLVLRGVPEGVDDGNLLLDKLAGAEICTFEPRVYTSQLPQLLEAKAEELRSQGRRPFIIPTGASDGTGIWGYVAAAMELQRDFESQNLQPSHIVCATGSGGTQAGLTLGVHLLQLETTVLGMAVCDDEAYFQRKVRADIEQWQQRYNRQVSLDDAAIVVNDRYIGPGYAKAGAEVFATIAWLARTEGIVLDPVYTGKAFHGLVSELRAGRLPSDRDIVFVHTGGIFGNFPQKQGYS